MAHIEKREQAKGLFVRGYKPPEVAKELSVHIRNVQRWYREWKTEQGLVEPTTNVKAEAEPITVVKVKVVEPTGTDAISKEVDDSKKWRKELDARNIENREIHRYCKLAWFNVFKQLNESGMIAEHIKVARESRQAICTHSELETRTFRDGRKDELDFTHSVKNVEAGGCLVVNPIAEVEDAVSAT